MDIPGFSDLTEIGRGGFGVVYRAPQEGFGRDVAIKVLTIDADRWDPVARRRFETETTTTGQLSTHPHIVTLHQTGVTPENHPYLVMAHLGGGSLGDRLHRDGPLDWSEVVDITIKIAGALGTAHRAGIVHRDVKPDNILIDDFGAPVLGDFGIASVTGASAATATAGVTGTIAFSPPESLDGRRPGVLADVFALAATAYALTTGHPPFARPGDESFTQVVARMMREDPPSLVAVGVPEPVAAAIAHGLARSPEARTHSVVRLGQDLQDAMRQLGRPAAAMVLPKDSDQGAATERTLAIRLDPAAPLRTPTARQPSTPSPPVATTPTAPAYPQVHHDLGTHPTSVQAVYQADSYADRPTPGRSPWRRVLLALGLVTALAVTGLLLALDRTRDNDVANAGQSADIPTAPVSSIPVTIPTDEGSNTEGSGPTGVASDGAAAPTTPPSTAGPSTPPPSTPPSSTPPPSTPTPATPGPTSTSSPSLPVEIDAEHPDSAALATTLGVWAENINNGRYDVAFDTYTQRLRDVVTFETFADGNSTSTIAAPRLLQVRTTGDSRTAIVSFRSFQDAEFGFEGQTCSQWRLQWVMVQGEGDRWQVDDSDRLDGSPAAC